MTAMDDGAPTPATLLWMARRIVDQHSEAPSEDRVTGLCAQCMPGGCRQLAWARQYLDFVSAGRR